MGMSSNRGITQLIASAARQAFPAFFNAAMDQVMGKMSTAGTTSLTPASLNTTVSQRVNFANPYPAGTNVAVVTQIGIPSPNAATSSVTNPDNAGFTLNVQRSASAGTAVPVYWVAQPVNV